MTHNEPLTMFQSAETSDEICRNCSQDTFIPVPQSQRRVKSLFYYVQQLEWGGHTSNSWCLVGQMKGRKEILQT